MYQLYYKTKSDRSPSEKERIYFTAHPRDFKLYFDDIVKDIHSTQSCTVFYDPDPTAERDEREMDLNLNQMQLFVIPITSDFLQTPNRARLVELPYALAHNIPVLPLMQESGLEKKFNEICGHLQFLDKNANDRTAIPYGEKLKTFLSSVLIGDEMTEKIRDAFHAYIFLSYRKKDREYAQTLMSLIHKNEFCRDIAIWYDEFLIPGEEFDEAIRKAIEKSNLFTLVVTPNLVNEINYVMTEEYPKAQVINKEILPVEMLETDRGELQNKYKGIPNVISHNDEIRLKDYLINRFKDIAMSETDRDPEHLFFMGLAYLGGIDVEVDHKKALELLTESADTGFSAAMKKLISMYRCGEGVERDHDSAILWQKKVVEGCRISFEAAPSEELFKAYFESLLQLGDFYAEQAKLSVAEDIYREMLSSVEAYEDRYDCRNMIFISHARLGDIFFQSDKHESAKEHYECALSLAERMAKENKDDISWLRLSGGYNNLGDLAMRMGNTALATRYYTEGFNVIRRFDRADAKEDMIYTLCLSYNKMGQILKRSGSPVSAESHYKTGLKKAKHLAKEYTAVKYSRNLAVTHNGFGDLLRDEGDLTLAKRHYEKALDIFEELVKTTGTVESSRDLAVSYHDLGDIAVQEGDVETAKSYYEKAFAITELLAKETDTAEEKRSLALSYNKLGNIAEQENELKRAMDYYKNSYDIISNLLKDSFIGYLYHMLFITSMHLGDVTEKSGETDSAKKHYEKCLDIISELQRIEWEPLDILQGRYMVYRKLGIMERQKKNFLMSDKYIKKSFKYAKAASELSSTSESKANLADAYYNMAISRNNTVYMRETCLILMELCDEHPDSVEYDSKRESAFEHIYKMNGKMRAAANISSILEFLIMDAYVVFSSMLPAGVADFLKYAGIIMLVPTLYLNLKYLPQKRNHKKYLRSVAEEPVEGI